MADTASKNAKELTEAYNQAVSSGFAAVNEGLAQTTASATLIGEAIQAERAEYGKALEQATTHARTRIDNFTGAMQAISASGPAGFGEEAKASVNKLVESEMAFYQAWTNGCMDYFSGVEDRRNARAQTIQAGNAKVVESTQEAVKSAVKYGEALVEWSMENANGAKS